jgi:PAS domain-containing protein
MNPGAPELRALLGAYRQVMEASWPELHPSMAKRSGRWPSASEAELQAELAGYLREASQPSCQVRLFWKLGPRFVFGGCNERFAREAGVPSAELVGLDDFDRRLPWVHQAAKYRADDEAVYQSGEPKLDILERQQSAAGITWVRAGKAPIRLASGAVTGVLGMYEVLDSATGRKVFGEQLKKRPSSA